MATLHSVSVPTARDIMAKWYVTLRPEMDVFEAIDVLASKRASGAPVVDAQGFLLGILTEKDCLRVTSAGAYEDLKGGTVADYMSEIKAPLGPDMDLFTVARQFLETNFVVLPVLEDGKPVGRISRQDMLRAIVQLQRQIEKVKKREEDDLKRMQFPHSINDLQQLAANQRPEHLAALLSNRYRE